MTRRYAFHKRLAKGSGQGAAAAGKTSEAAPGVPSVSAFDEVRPLNLNEAAATEKTTSGHPSASGSKKRSWRRKAGATATTEAVVATVKRGARQPTTRQAPRASAATKSKLKASAPIKAATPKRRPAPQASAAEDGPQTDATTTAATAAAAPETRSEAKTAAQHSRAADQKRPSPWLDRPTAPTTKAVIDATAPPLRPPQRTAPSTSPARIVAAPPPPAPATRRLPSQRMREVEEAMRASDSEDEEALLLPSSQERALSPAASDYYSRTRLGDIHFSSQWQLFYDHDKHIFYPVHLKMHDAETDPEMLEYCMSSDERLQGDLRRMIVSVCRLPVVPPRVLETKRVLVENVLDRKDKYNGLLAGKYELWRQGTRIPMSRYWYTFKVMLNPRYSQAHGVGL